MVNVATAVLSAFSLHCDGLVLCTVVQVLS